MRFRKAAMVCAVTTALLCTTLNVSAVEKVPAKYIDQLQKSDKVDLIINVDAYKAAYSDLAAAFGDDTDAYIEHYLTKGIYEGRTKGVLFDPLAYAEAYGDVKKAFGDDILAIVDHYVNFGVAENRTEGTAGAYVDIDAAENGGPLKSTVQNSAVQKNVSGAKVQNAQGKANGEAVYYGGSTAGSSAGNGNAAAGGAAANNPSADSAGNYSAPVNNAASYSAPVNNAAADSAPVSSAADNSAPVNNETAGSAPVSNNSNYHHTTEIYDDSGLLRVEYYDDNNKLFEYSEVSDYDGSTNSYTENVYSWDYENDVQVHERTDVYVDGVLVSSQGH